MIRHVVVFALVTDDPEQRRRDVEVVRERLEALAPIVPGVRTLEVGIDLGLVAGHWDVVLVSEHDSVEALERYQAHPEHRSAVASIDPLVRERACVDHEAAAPPDPGTGARA